MPDLCRRIVKCREDPPKTNSEVTLSTDNFSSSIESNYFHLLQENNQDLISSVKTSSETLLCKSTSQDAERRERAAAKRAAFIKLVIIQGENTGALKLGKEKSSLNIHGKNNGKDESVDNIEDGSSSDLIDQKNRQFRQELTFLQWGGLTAVEHQVRKMLAKQQRSIEYKTMMAWLQLHSSKILFSISTLHRSRSVLRRAFENWLKLSGFSSL